MAAATASKKSAELGSRKASWRARSAPARAPSRSARRAPRAARAARRARPRASPRVGAIGDQVGLGEVAVVVRLLLRAQRGELAAGRDRSGASPARPSPPRLDDLALALDLGARSRARRKRNEFMFFSSVLVPELVGAGRPHRDVGVDAQRALLHVRRRRRRAARSVARSSSSHSRALRRRAQVGLGDDLDQRRAAAVEVDERGARSRGSGRWRRRGSVFAASSSRWARWIAHVAELRRRAQSGCRTGRSGSPWAGRDRSSSCGGRSSAAAISQPSARPIFIAVVDRRLVRHRQRRPGRRGRPGRCAMFGSSPKLSSQPQNIFVRVASWTWISRPITGSSSGTRASLPRRVADGGVEADRAARARRRPRAACSRRTAGAASWKPTGSPAALGRLGAARRGSRSPGSRRATSAPCRSR